MFRVPFGRLNRAQATLDALERSLAVIEFTPAGVILRANENFCGAMGYTLAEIKGKHHSMFVEPEYAGSAEYKAFWTNLAAGKFESREYKRLGKNNREVWIQASYNPIFGARGVVDRVVKVASVVTEQKLKAAECEGKINAISLAQAVIEFTPQGEILTANGNFLSVMGYRLDEVQGKHHRMFVQPGYAQSAEYAAFWDKLNRGELVSASFKRFGKGGKEVWIQASYNPIFDMSGRVVKVVKFASDITDLTQIGAALARLADGDLTQSIEKPFAPTFDKLRIDFNAAHEKLRSTLCRVAESTGSIESGSHEISNASNDLSRRTEQQAASLEETAAALDEITATVKKTSVGSTDAQAAVANAKTNAEQSSEIVGRAIKAMGTIEQSSTKISQIIGVIDEIAFQTNLLALNAGVEAARAGEAGRGFAVVASEVRALAQRSAEAAKEIKSLISASTRQVRDGVALVDETGHALGRILEKVGEINTVVSEIALSTQEQATALQQVNTAINQMDQVTQQNAAMVEESTAAAHSLKMEIKDLASLIAQFRLGQEHVVAPAAPQSEGFASHRPALKVIGG